MFHQKLARTWIIGLGIGIMLMIVVGGYTRLTHAGLSLVDWKPIIGTIPPLTAEDWQEEWMRYQQFPEFQKGIVTDFALFQKIFWIEYTHRLLGRLVGLWLIMGLIGMLSSYQKYPSWFRKKIYWWTLGITFQGWLGWYMVQSGLVHDPQVSPYRLMAHFWMALALLTSVMRAHMRLSGSNSLAHHQQPRRLSYIAHALVGGVLTWGCLVAGHKAGLIYNTFPLMEGMLIPSDAWFYHPWITNLWCNPTCVQMIHRYLAIITIMLITLLFLNLRHRNNLIWLILGWSQGALGVVTLLTHTHIHPALSHQACGVLLWLWGIIVVYPPQMHTASKI